MALRERETSNAMQESAAANECQQPDADQRQAVMLLVGHSCLRWLPAASVARKP